MIDNVRNLIYKIIIFSVTTTLATTTKARDSGYDVVFMFDSSVSKQSLFEEMKNFAIQLTRRTGIDTGEYRIGFMRYSTDAETLTQLNKYDRTDDLIVDMLRMNYRPGESNLQNALDTVMLNMFREDYGDRDFARNLIVLLTGVDQSSNSYDAFRAAERAEDLGINLYTVGFYLNDTFEINEVSTHPLSTFRYLINNRGDTQLAMNELARSSKNYELVGQI
jgi:hypothetical protein